jgi:hypothetical protein
MDVLIAIGIVAGILAGVLIKVSASIHVLTWVAFVSWACFYAAGGKAKGLVTGIVGNVSGAIWGFLMVYTSQFLPFPDALPVTVGIGACLICVVAKWKVLSFIPGAYAGCAAFFGTGAKLGPTVLSLVAGALIGWCNEAGGIALSKIGRKTAVVEKEDAVAQ